MTVKMEASAGGIPHDTVMAYGLIGSLVGIYLTYLNVLSGTEIFSFFGGLAAVAALVWGANTIKHLCSYGLGTGVPSAGMIALGSGAIAMIFASRYGMLAPIVAVIVAGILGAIVGFVSNKIVNMNIPVMERSLTELSIVGAMSLMGFTAMLGGTFIFDEMVIGTSSFMGFVFANYGMSLLGGGTLAVTFMLAAIALQHPFNACLGPGEQQDRTLMLGAECGFLSMIPIALMSFAFITFASAVIALLVSVAGWCWTYVQFIELSKRDAYAWLDAKPIHEPKGGE